MRKTELQKELAKIAPSVSIVTIWEHDPGHTDIRTDCDGFDNEDPEDWQAWQSEIKALAIVNGEEITGSAYLGGTWGKAGDTPEMSNPTISGYENQMTVEALEELGEQTTELEISNQVINAIRHCKAKSREEYERQMSERQTA